MFRATKGRPTLIILDSHIGYGSPHKSRYRRGPRRPSWATEEVKTDASAPTAGRRTPSSLSRTACMSISMPESDARGAEARDALGDAVRQLSRPVSRTSPPKSTRCSAASCRRNGIATCRTSPPTPKASPDATRRSGAECAGTEHPLVHGRLGGCRAVEPHDAQIRRRRRFRARNSGRPEFAFRHPRARDGGDRQRDVAVEAAARSVRRSSSSAITPARRCGFPR